MSFHEDVILSLEHMEKGDIESLIFQCYESFPAIRMIFKVDVVLSKAFETPLPKLKKEIQVNLDINDSDSWKRSSEYDFVIDYVYKSLQRHIIDADFSNSAKKEIFREVINVAKDSGVKIEDPYFWFEKLEEMADFYNNNYAAPGESIDPHP